MNIYPREKYVQQLLSLRQNGFTIIMPFAQYNNTIIHT